MLSKHQCPHTGIINFFTRTDPFVSVGSIIEHDGERNGSVYHWRWYDAARTISGISKDMRSAEERLRSAYRQGVDGKSQQAAG